MENVFETMQGISSSGHTAPSRTSPGSYQDAQARHSGDFMTTKACLSGVIGGMYKKTVKI